jgi:uncharacterized membrane protein
MINPFDPRAVLLAKHAQHVVLVHFPIALFLTGTLFDLAAKRIKRAALSQAAYLNIVAAALSAVPTLLTGVVAWRWQLEGAKLKGMLLLHLVLGGSATVLICWFAWLRHRRQLSLNAEVELPRHLLALELLIAAWVGAAAHVGGVVSGLTSTG